MNNIDLEAVDSDYQKSVQDWDYKFSKDNQKTKECLSNYYFEPCKTSEWDRFAKSLKEEIKRLKEVEVVE